jgi:hypothetical protein
MRTPLVSTDRSKNQILVLAVSRPYVDRNPVSRGGCECGCEDADAIYILSFFWGGAALWSSGRVFVFMQENCKSQISETRS